MPAFGINGHVYRTLRLVGAQIDNIFDSSNGKSETPILFPSVYANVAYSVISMITHT